MKNKILVTGATGNIGKELVSLLKEKDANFSAATSNGHAIEGVNTVKLDFSDKASMEKAMQGIDTLFLLLPSHPDVVQWGENAIEIARQNGIKHIVRSSGMFANTDSDLLIEQQLGSTDEEVKSSGIDYTITSPSSFMQNFVTTLATDYKAGVIYQAAADAQISWVDTRDIAAVNAEALLNPSKYRNKTLKITGSERLNYQEAISLMNQAMGKETQYVDISNEAASQTMADMHFPPYVIELLISLSDSIKQGHFVEISDTVEKVTGKQPIKFKQFIEDNEQVWI